MWCDQQFWSVEQIEMAAVDNYNVFRQKISDLTQPKLLFVYKTDISWNGYVKVDQEHEYLKVTCEGLELLSKAIDANQRFEKIAKTDV